MSEKDERLVKIYKEEVGKEPRNLPPDHPDLWQWEYRGTPVERAMLEEMLYPDPEETYEQEEMF